jgi:hypothetical protein
VLAVTDDGGFEGVEGEEIGDFLACWVLVLLDINPVATGN